MQHKLTVSYWQPIGPIFKHQAVQVDAWLLKPGLIGCQTTSVTNYQSMPHNIPEEQMSYSISVCVSVCVLNHWNSYYSLCLNPQHYWPLFNIWWGPACFLNHCGSRIEHRKWSIISCCKNAGQNDITSGFQKSGRIQIFGIDSKRSNLSLFLSLSVPSLPTPLTLPKDINCSVRSWCSSYGHFYSNDTWQPWMHIFTFYVSLCSSLHFHSYL